MYAIRDVLIPVQPGHAAEAGWTAATSGRPRGVTWHWTATATLAEARAMLGGPNPTRRGEASAHYCVGRTTTEGIDRWVSLDDRSYHAGVLQTLRWDGRVLGGPNDKGSRTCIGVETVHPGYARDGFPAAADWAQGATPDGKPHQVQPWPEEQVRMCIYVGQLIQARWPHLTPRDHHGHHDLCPQYKEDVITFPFARVLRGIYGNPNIPDVWTPLWTVRQRQEALLKLGYDLGRGGADNLWGTRSVAALKAFQSRHGLPANGLWTVAVSWKVYEATRAKLLPWPAG